MPKSRRRPEARPYRPYCPVDLVVPDRGTMAWFNRGVASVPGLKVRELRAAIGPALNRMCSLGMDDELHAIAVMDTVGEFEQWLDFLADLMSGDSRWDTWRTYRRASYAIAN